MKQTAEDMQLDMQDLINPYAMIAADIDCGTCGISYPDITYSGKDHATAKRVFAETLFYAGWRIDGKRLCCPKCTARKKETIHGAYLANQKKRIARKAASKVRA